MDKVESPAPEIPPAAHKRGGIVVPHTPTVLQTVVSWMAFIFLRALAMTLRVKWNEHSGITGQPDQPVIFCIWHNRLAFSMDAYGRLKKNRRVPGMAALVSASKDGGLLAAILQRFQVHPVRGSSSRRGPQALLELTTWAEDGYDLAITPDGPRGPRYSVQEGIMALAQLTGLPIVPFSCHAQWKFQAGSWDRFQIPLPFSRCEMNSARPILIPRDISDAEREVLRKQLEQTMKELSRE
jgi:lysophospholipid acyltransferase (LPLAT)-like uncharacterized protein